MRKIALLCLLLLCITQLRAQRSAVSVGWEPAFQGFGVSFDRRIAPRSHWGYRIGVGYTTYKGLPEYNYREKGITVPLDLNFLAGGKHHMLEAAFGTSLAYIQYSYEETNQGSHETGCDYPGRRKHYLSHEYTHRYFGRFTQLFHLSAGYRFQMDKGLIVRAGLSIFDDFHDVFYFGNEDGDHLRPYLSIGYTF